VLFYIAELCSEKIDSVNRNMSLDRVRVWLNALDTIELGAVQSNGPGFSAGDRTFEAELSQQSCIAKLGLSAGFQPRKRACVSREWRKEAWQRVKAV
jgi:hypothetical protein